MKPQLFILMLCFLLYASLRVLAQPIITAQPVNHTNLVGTTASFSATATGTTPLSYQWAFGGPPVDLVAATNASLVISNVQTSNQGAYQVVITNSEGAVTSLVATLTVPSPATLQFSAPTYKVDEAAGTVTLIVQRSGSTNLAITIDYSTRDGTASNGVKYTSASGTLAFAPGETNKTIVVAILNEGLVESTRSFSVTLANPGVGVVTGARFSATVFITDNDVGTQFQLSSYNVAEDAGNAVLRVVRGDDGTAPVTVDLYTSDGTATNGIDYVGASNTLSFAAEETLKLVSVPILNNALKQPNRSFTVTLTNQKGISLGAVRTTTVTIVDNDQGFHFDSASHTVMEDAGVARLAVLRGTDDTQSTLKVDFATADSTAINGENYQATNGTLVFGPGEKVKLLGIPILNNGVKDPLRSFRVSLANPGEGASLASPSNVLVQIVDNDPGVGFERSSYTNNWGDGPEFKLAVLRGNDWSLGPITVDYTTANLSATAGQDYQAVSGTLQFEPGETIKEIAIPLLRTRADPGAKTFRVVLRNPTGGATLGLYFANISIVGAYATIAPPFATGLSISPEGNHNVIAWDGGGRLQRADRATGPWQTLTNLSSPCAVQSPSSSTFYRVTRPRPVTVYVPSSYDGQKAVPLVLLLHGYSETAAYQEGWMHFQPLAESRGFLYSVPDSTIDSSGNEFWNATDVCCDLDNTGIDDAGYLRNLIEEISSRLVVDRKRIYLIGHSNGGFMAYRMACQSADLIAGIASLAGVTFLGPSQCRPSQPVNILHVHGTVDDTILYTGGTFALNGGNLIFPPYPGAMRCVQIWAAYNGATDPVTDAGPSMDLDLDVPGIDGVVTRYTNYRPGGAVELWTIVGGNHSPTLFNGTSAAEFSPRVIDWLLAHPKP
jgi:polyhydroxybutyrate depolymerase